jgi:hypothetical protein
MNWNNVDLRSREVESSIIDAYTFETLLLEINCNVKEINRETVKAQFAESLKSHIDSAKEVFSANLDNIVKESQRKKNQK